VARGIAFARQRKEGGILNLKGGKKRKGARPFYARNRSSGQIVSPTHNRKGKGKGEEARGNINGNLPHTGTTIIRKAAGEKKGSSSSRGGGGGRGGGRTSSPSLPGRTHSLFSTASRKRGLWGFSNTLGKGKKKILMNYPL